MQTFLPEHTFIDSAMALDRARLGKQRVEAWQLVLVEQRLARGDERVAWAQHPASRMWRGYMVALSRYGIAVCSAWRARGYKDSLLPRFQAIVDAARSSRAHWSLPSWWECEATRAQLVASHRNALCYKLPQHYAPLWPTAHAEYNYLWPLSNLETYSA